MSSRLALMSVRIGQILSSLEFKRLRRIIIRVALLIVGLLDMTAVLRGQSAQDGPAQTEAGTSTEDLQKATQNPVASLISVPIQNNSNFGIGPFDRTQGVLNIQPVIPMRASENWNLIIRWS